jgi:FKBP-type peptidyl-prolyl cis-trans isomerase
MKNIPKNEAIALFAGIMVVAILFFGARLNPFTPTSAPSEAKGDVVNLTNAKQQQAAAVQAVSSAMDSNGKVTKLIVEDVRPGAGFEVKEGDTVTVNYVGTLQDGTQFDSSYSRGTPFTFELGAGTVIKGWDQGLVGMKVGGQRILVIPSSLAYGNREIGPIPADSTLIFSIELVDAK